MAIQCLFFTMFATMSVIAEGSAFLHATPMHHEGMVNTEDVQNTMLAEIEGSLGVGIASKRMTEMKAILTPMFKSLPKNKNGNLDHVTVRYVLHRVFVQRHGWSIKGLDAAGGAWNSSSPTGILKDQVPAFIENMFEERLGGRGLGLQELAVFASTIEHLVHSETIGRLGSALNVHKLLPTATMTHAQADEVLDTYMMAYILGEHLSNMTLEDAQEAVRGMPEMFLGWADTQKFVRKIRQELTSSMAVGTTKQKDLSFAMVAKVAETVGENFGVHQDDECKRMKSSLMKMEDRQSGRVRLSDFYRGALAGADGSWEFQESIAYLRQLGALDESNQDEPRVMIPNYLYSQTNCIASSDYYSVCCLNECENLLGHLEKDIAAPEATSSRIAELISALPSSTVSASRALSPTLRTRLDKIATDHGGFVQLHSRLFAQWMHHAYPRECPFPHLSGTTSQDRAEDWGEELSVASPEELRQYTSTAKSFGFANPSHFEPHEDVHDLMMWHHEEEHLVHRPEAPASTGFAGSVRNVVFFAAVASVVVGLVRTSSSASTIMGSKEEKFMV